MFANSPFKWVDLPKYSIDGIASVQMFKLKHVGSAVLYQMIESVYPNDTIETENTIERLKEKIFSKFNPEMRSPGNMREIGKTYREIENLVKDGVWDEALAETVRSQVKAKGDDKKQLSEILSLLQKLITLQMQSITQKKEKQIAPLVSYFNELAVDCIGVMIEDVTNNNVLIDVEPKPINEWLSDEQIQGLSDYWGFNIKTWKDFIPDADKAEIIFIGFVAQDHPVMAKDTFFLNAHDITPSQDLKAKKAYLEKLKSQHNKSISKKTKSSTKAQRNTSS